MASTPPSLITQAPRSGGHDNAKERETEEGKYHHVYKHENSNCASPRPTSAELSLAHSLVEVPVASKLTY